VEDLGVEIDRGINCPAEKLDQECPIGIEGNHCGRRLNGLRLDQVGAFRHQAHVEVAVAAWLLPAGCLIGA
jgi:hypothetical protein